MHPPIESLQLHRDPSGGLVLVAADGTRHVGVEPVRAFPLSDPERFISLVDGQGHELATIDDLAHLPPAARELILRELTDREFLPRIERVLSVIDTKEPKIWDVITDRGPVQFLLGDSDDIRRLGPQRAILLDVHGGRYYIPDSQQLDPRSQQILARYL
jgi:Domain of unknown function (DUF1854)